MTYLKDHIRFILLYFTLAAFVGVMAMLDADSRMLSGNYIYMAVISFSLFAACVAIDYAIRRKQAIRLNELIASPDKTPVLPPPADYKDAQYAALIAGLYSDYTKRLAAMEDDFQENKEFMAAWAHEIKTPVTAAHLLLDAEPDFEGKYALEEELDRIGEAVERVLFHTRSDSFTKDYVISEESLERLVKESVKKHSTIFIRKHIRVTVEVPPALNVLTDRKWLAFIIDQLVSNALKYTGEGGEIALTAEVTGSGAALFCRDNGRGIAKEDIERIFSKSFTGRNGREPGSFATGLGLYLARKLARKLGHDVSVSSEYGEGTTAVIRFKAAEGEIRFIRP